jgi:hypothetical protein
MQPFGEVFVSRKGAGEGKTPDHGIGKFLFGLERGGYGDFWNSRFVLARSNGSFSA